MVHCRVLRDFLFKFDASLNLSENSFTQKLLSPHTGRKISAVFLQNASIHFFRIDFPPLGESGTTDFF